VRTRIFESFEKEIFKDKEAYFLRGKLIFERIFKRFRKTVSFVILSSRDFDITRIEEITKKLRS